MIGYYYTSGLNCNTHTYTHRERDAGQIAAKLNKVADVYSNQTIKNAEKANERDRISLHANLPLACNHFYH